MKKDMTIVSKDIDAYYESWFRINQAYSIWAQQRGTTDNMMFALYEIHSAKEGCTQQQLCRKLFLPKQTVSFLLSKLEKQGYIGRSENPRDRRNKLVFLHGGGPEIRAEAPRRARPRRGARIFEHDRRRAP